MWQTTNLGILGKSGRAIIPKRGVVESPTCSLWGLSSWWQQETSLAESCADEERTPRKQTKLEFWCSVWWWHRGQRAVAGSPSFLRWRICLCLSVGNPLELNEASSFPRSTCFIGINVVHGASAFVVKERNPRSTLIYLHLPKIKGNTWKLQIVHRLLTLYDNDQAYLKNKNIQYLRTHWTAPQPIRKNLLSFPWSGKTQNQTYK